MAAPPPDARRCGFGNGDGARDACPGPGGGVAAGRRPSRAGLVLSQPPLAAADWPGRRAAGALGPARSRSSAISSRRNSGPRRAGRASLGRPGRLPLPRRVRYGDPGPGLPAPGDRRLGQPPCATGSASAADVLLNPNLGAEAWDYGLAGRPLLLLDTPYVLLRPEFQRWLPWRRAAPSASASCWSPAAAAIRATPRAWCSRPSGNSACRGWKSR